MKPYYQDPHNTLYNQDFRTNDLPDECVQMVCCSPPYWGLRKYSGEQELIWGGDKDCEHQWVSREWLMHNGRGDAQKSGKYSTQESIPDMPHSDNTCSLCGAWKGAYGLEPTPEMYIQHTIEIFEEVKRVLRSDGVCFVNIGDSYFASGGAHKPEHANPGLSKSASRGGVPHDKQSGKRGKELPDLKAGDSSSENPCDECVKIRLLRNSGKSDYPSQVSEPSIVESNHSHKVSQPDHQGSLRSASQGDHNGGETSGLYSSPDSVDGQPLVSQVSTNPESSEQLQGECLPKDDWFSSPDVLASLSLVFQGCGHRKACPFFVQTFAGVSQESLVEAGSKVGIALTDDALASHIQGKVSDSPSYPYYTTLPHLKAKDMCLIPQRLMIAFQDAGWWVRSDIIWSKPNPMPESVTDRPTNSHEYILLLTKSAKYYWDADAVRETNKPESIERYRYSLAGSYTPGSAYPNEKREEPQNWNLNPTGRNIRSVWEFPTQPYPEAHFAVFPEKLPELCIKAATPEVGCCSKCGNPWARVTELTEEYKSILDKTERWSQTGDEAIRRQRKDHPSNVPVKNKTLGWQPTCKCKDADKVPSIALDPFAGAGTTLWVAKKLNRQAVGYEISEEYCQLTIERLRQQVML